MTWNKLGKLTFKRNGRFFFRGIKREFINQRSEQLRLIGIAGIEAKHGIRNGIITVIHFLCQWSFLHVQNCCTKVKPFADCIISMRTNQCFSLHTEQILTFG